MHIISRYIVTSLCCYSTIDIAHQDWCIYALEKKLYKIVSFFLALFSGFLLHAPIESALIFISTNFLRTRISGWHAQSPFLCIALTISTCCFGGILAKWLASVVPIAALFLFLLNGCLCLLFKPIDNPSLHLTNAEIYQNKKLGLYRTCFMMLISLLLFLFTQLTSLSISLQSGILVALMSTFIKEQEKS